MSRLDMRQYSCLLLEPDEALAGLIAACLQRHGLDVTIRTEDPGTVGCPDADIILVDADARDLAGLAAGSGVPLMRLSSEPGGLPCTCRREVCVCRLAKAFSPPYLIMRVRAALAARYEARREGKPPPPPGRCVLDVCSGSGYSSCLAADDAGGGALIVGVDHSEEAPREARALVETVGYRTIAFVVGPASSGCFASVVVRPLRRQRQRAWRPAPVRPQVSRAPGPQR
ncbi:MAG: hypothetical protein U9R79_02985 [Armatimonadota bacterium]|nr:hypothetical protein [Armatimonadota bacterium]